MRVTAGLAGGLVTCGGVYVLQDLPEVVVIALLAGQVLTVLTLTRAHLRQQQQAQRNAVRILKALGDKQLSVLIRDNGQTEIHPTTQELAFQQPLSGTEHGQPS